MKILRIILFIMFFGEGLTKLLGLSFQTSAFLAWGYPLWFMYVIGVLEILGAIGLLITPLRLYANIGLILIMMGAFYTHVSSGDPFLFMSAAVLASILLLVHLYSLRHSPIL